MAITRKQLVTGTSVIYLLALTALAGYALRNSTFYSLPIPNAIGALVIALPPLAGVALEIVFSLNEKLAARGELQASRIFQVVVGFFLVFESVLATLAGTHLSPTGSLTCALRERWQQMVHLKEGERIRRIQDAFSCCGFNSLKDMPFPFPDKTHGPETCMIRFERERSCFEPWRNEERKVAIMFLIVPLAVAIILAPSNQSSWLPSHIKLPTEDNQDAAAPPPRRPRPAIGYRDLEERRVESSLERAVDSLNKDSRLAMHIEGSRSKSMGLLNDTQRWREEE